MYLPINNICHSRINGPGNRLVIWVQGCKFNCKGCFNPETHSYRKDQMMNVEELVTMINNDATIEGITLSGGEPLDYPKQLKNLLQKVEQRLTIILYSGFSFHEIQHSPILMSVVKMTDVSIVGRYDKRLAHPYCGKKFIISRGRIDVNYFIPKIVIEYSINNKSVTKTGVFPVVIIKK